MSTRGTSGRGVLPSEGQGEEKEKEQRGWGGWVSGDKCE